MKIGNLSRKKKPPQSLHLDEAVNIYGNNMFADEWSKNPYAKGEPFSKGSIIRRRNGKHIVSVFYYNIEENKPVQHKKTKILQRKALNNLSNFDKMFKAIIDKLSSDIHCKKLSYTVISHRDEYIKSEDISKEAAWLNKQSRIFCTGYFPVGINWGRIIFNEDDVIKIFNADDKTPITNKMSGVTIEDKLDPRAKNSLLRIILILLAKHYQKNLTKEKFFAMAAILEGFAVQQGIEIEKKTIAKWLEEASNLPDFYKVNSLHKEIVQ